MFAGLESDERQHIEEYCQQHGIQDLLQGLVDEYLDERPSLKPRQHFAQQLRLQLMKEKADETDDHSMVASISSAAKVPGHALKRLFEASKKITSEIVPKDTIDVIIEESLKLLNCDRLSLFIYDKKIDMLVLNASNLQTPIRVKSGQGIAGHVFKTQQVVNIPNCYKDARFDQTFDMKTGYRTSNLLAMPIVDFEGEAMGVIQAINKLELDSPGFSVVDEILLDNLTEHVSVALRNAEVYRAAIVTSERANALLSMLQSLSEDLGAQSLILGVSTHASELVRADRCSVFLVDERREELFSVASDSGKEIRIPKSVGIAGECATENKLIVIDDAYADPRFNSAFDKQTGYRTQSIIAVPVKRPPTHDTACAVIQMINKTEFDGEIGKFDEEDVKVLETYATFVATKLSQSSLVSGNSHRPSLPEQEFPHDSHHHPHHRRGSALAAQAGKEMIFEGDEEEAEA
eukprot:TRINITY_DN60820_c0_g1_i1.p1 TRINITY_DN60820_c0_g1~~TRINITY_DN60820_c0_g1_i1.p1  ORF type:complete len:462 (+),score=85.83 TRINITY_DN60820_c0_g1_i1:103-1488(+)